MSAHNGLDFDLIELQEVNLFVGISGSGKSKLLSSLFNVARFAIGNENKTSFFLGEWNIKSEINNEIYIWNCKRKNDNNQRSIVIKEQIEVFNVTTGLTTIIVDR